MVKMYDFGTDTSNVSANERRALAWPIAVWSCYIPESDSQDLNILEHLILQMVDNGYKDPKTVLCSQVGFNKDLVNAAIEACRNKDYFDSRYKELILSADGKKIVRKFDNPYSADLDASKKSKKVFMIQDCVTKSVIPVFDIDKLPQFYFEEEGAIEVHYDNFTGGKPRSAAVKTALRYWAKLCHNRRRGLVTGTNTIDISQPSEKVEDIEEFIPFEDEVDWEDIREDGSVKEEKTLADKEDEDKQRKLETNIKHLTILDDFPEIYWARGFIAINRNAPDEAIIISPFGERLDDWFRTVINRLRTCDSAFEEEIQLFLMLKRDELKDSIAFGNDLNISLFNEYPYICNDAEYKAVKATISRLTVSRNRFQKGEDDSINFAQALRTAYEACIRLVVKKNPYLLAGRNLEYDAYKKNLSMLVDSYSFLDYDIFREYSGINIYKNMTQTNEDEGYATAFLALFLMDAWKNKSGQSMDLLRNIPSLPIRIKELTSNLKRDVKKNKKGDGTAASHGGDAIAELKFTEEKALKQYTEFEEIFRAIYNRFMEGK